jgi:xanthine dehydrogenase accessory factor
VRHIDRDSLDAVQPHVGPGAWVVVATQGRRDVQGLRLALALQPRQVSFVASARKAQVLKDALLAAGADAAAVAAIVAPAGHPIAAETPEEIALSVLAALVAARRQGTVVAPVVVDALATVPAVVAPAAVAAPAPGCCGGSVGELPPLPAVPPRQEPVAPLAPVTPAVGGSCCGG